MLTPDTGPDPGRLLGPKRPGAGRQHLDLAAPLAAVADAAQDAPRICETEISELEVGCAKRAA